MLSPADGTDAARIGGAMPAQNRQKLASPLPETNCESTPRQAAAWRERLAPWYLAYLILGLINSGMLPFLLPLWW
jgi:hypothetical protein